MNARRGIGRSAIVLTAACGIVGPSPLAASASPSNCTAVSGYDAHADARAWCDSGSGQVRAWIDCWNDYGRKLRFFGSWVGVGATSIASCTDSYYSPDGYGYQTK